jgi:hypothetical protein
VIGWEIALKTPDDDGGDLVLWQLQQLRMAARTRTDAIVIEPRKSLAQLGDAIDLARLRGIHVSIIGDAAGYGEADVDPTCVVISDAARGGILIGEIVRGERGTSQDVRALIVVRPEPVSNRPRAAYAMLAVLSSTVGSSKLTCIAAEPGEIDPVIVKTVELLQDPTVNLVVSLPTDSDLLEFARRAVVELGAAVLTRLALVGYDGNRGDGTTLDVSYSHIRVLGTVDTLPRAQGAALAAELIRVAAGNPPRGHIAVDSIRVDVRA